MSKAFTPDRATAIIDAGKESPDELERQRRIRTGIEKIRALFHAVGFWLIPHGENNQVFGAFLFAMPGEVVVLDHNDTEGLRTAFGSLQKTRCAAHAFVDLFAWIAQDPATIDAIAEMQLRAVDHFCVVDPVLAVHIDSLSVYGLATKIQHAINFNASHVVRWPWERFTKEVIASNELNRDMNQRFLERETNREPPTRERDIELAKGMMRFVGHARELNRLRTAMTKTTFLAPNSRYSRAAYKPVQVLGADITLSFFKDRWYYIAATRHWEWWLNGSLRKSDAEGARDRSLYIDEESFEAVMRRDYLTASRDLRALLDAIEEKIEDPALRDALEKLKANPDLQTLTRLLADKAPPDIARLVVHDPRSADRHRDPGFYYVQHNPATAPASWTLLALGSLEEIWSLWPATEKPEVWIRNEAWLDTTSKFDPLRDPVRPLFGERTKEEQKGSFSGWARVFALQFRAAPEDATTLKFFTLGADGEPVELPEGSHTLTPVMDEA